MIELHEALMDREVLALNAQIQIWAKGTNQFAEWSDGIAEYSLTDEAMAIAADISEGDFVKVRVLSGVDSTPSLPCRIATFTLSGANDYCVGNFLAEDYDIIKTSDGKLTFDLFLESLGETGSKIVEIVLPS